MSNWCCTRISIESDNEKGLENLNNLIKEWTSKNYMKNDFGTDWLGNIVLGSGIGTVDAGKDTDLNCRGTLNELDMPSGNQLLICTETAWVPMLTMWVKLVDKYLPGAELIYESDEESDYATNDPELTGKFIIDSWDVDDVESDWEAGEAKVVEILQGLLDTTVADVDTLIKLLDESELSDKMAVYRWQNKPASEFS